MLSQQQLSSLFCGVVKSILGHKMRETENYVLIRVYGNIIGRARDWINLGAKI